MDGEAVREVAQLAQKAAGSVVRTEEGREYVVGELTEVRPERASPLGVSSLQGLADYVEANVDGLALETVLVSVLGPEDVKLMTRLSETHRQRETLVAASYAPPTFRYGRQQAMEEFITGVQACFVATDDRAELLKVLGNLKAESVRTQEDDGVTQEVTARAGVATREDVEVPNPVELRPYRTFTEIEQPASEFVVRLQSGGAGITAALHEADGGAWAQEARERIAAWLGDNLPDEVTVIR